MSIRVEQLTFRYPDKCALSNLDFALQKGEFCALLGPNGAGKSTLFALLTRLYALQTGKITLNDISLTHRTSRVMQHIGVVFQQSTLDLDLSVRQNLHYHASLHGMSWKEARSAIDRELSRLEMLERADEKVRALNGGHRRRVEIARSLLHSPSVLLLDEPSTGLDPSARSHLNTYVRKLCADTQLTVLWATHLIEEVYPDDRVLLLHQGQLLSSGTGRDLCQLSGQTSLASAFAQLTGKGDPQ